MRGINRHIIFVRQREKRLERLKVRSGIERVPSSNLFRHIRKRDSVAFNFDALRLCFAVSFGIAATRASLSQRERGPLTFQEREAARKLGCEPQVAVGVQARTRPPR